MSQKKKIALDVDGVLLQFSPVFDKVAAEVLGREIVHKPNEFGLLEYDLLKRAGITSEQANQILNYMVENGHYANFDPLPNVDKALAAIKAEDFEIHIVTAIPDNVREMRLHNLKTKLDFEPDEIHCVGMGMSKGEALRKINPDVFIDDRIDYLASAQFIYHLVWCDQREVQKDNDSLVDVHVHSLHEWTVNHMPRVVSWLNNYYHLGEPAQMPLKLENANRKYGMK